jgi:hypothetical protein
MSGERILEDRKFVDDLAGSRPGRILQAHISSVSKYENGQADESSAQEALSNERVLIAAIARSLQYDRPMPCGLPFPLPKFIAICNLSGERLLLHGSSPSILRKLCTRSSVLPPRDVASQVLAFEAFPNINVANVEKFVLLSYSLPWQAGVGSAFWSLSCCDYRADDRHIRDRMLTFTSQSHTAFCGKSVLDPTDTSVLVMNCETMPMVTAKQMKDLSESFCCCSLDVTKGEEKDGDNDDVVTTKGGDASKEQLQLAKIVQGMKAQRTKDHKEIEKLKADLLGCENEMLEVVRQCELRINKLKEKHEGDIATKQAAFDACSDKAKELLGLKESQRAALNAELNALKASYEEKASEHTEAKKELKKQRSKMDELGRKSAAKDQLVNAASAKFKMQIKVLEDSLETAKAELATVRREMEQQNEKDRAEMVCAHEKEWKKLKTAVEGKERIVNQLSEVSERREAEIQSLQAVDALRGAELEEKERAMETIKAELAAARAELAKPKTRSVGVSTRTSSTSTHSCATTQTPPPRPATPPMPSPKQAAAEKDVDVVTTDTATTATDCEASGRSSNGEPAHVLCQKAERALQTLITHVLNGHSPPSVSPPPCITMSPAAFQPQFLHPNHQMIYAQPPPQYFHQPQFVPQPQQPLPQQQQQQPPPPQQHRMHKSQGSVRLYRG